MDYLLPKFTEATGIVVQVTAVGTGQALRLGENGDVDALLVHAREAEEAFVAAGHGIDRADVMVNDFVIVGPPSDPAGVEDAASTSDALERIARGGHPFVSRGDESGTHRREMKLWQDSGVAPAGGWYREVGLGMGRTLQIADQMSAYTLTDRGSWLALQKNLQLALSFEPDPPISNPYGIIAVDPARHGHVNYAAASRLIEWITSAAARQAIADFRVGDRSLFEPASKPAP
jgi:tungstate transport system substrate-binding protein